MNEDRARLDGKVAVVTGGGRGIGRATALLLARAGATVVVASRRTADCEAVAASIREAAGRGFAVATDVTDWAAVEHLAAETIRLAGRPDIVVVSAGAIEAVGNTWEVPPGRWAEVVDINLVGAFNTVRGFVPGMGAGVIVLVSSGAARSVTPGWSAYGAAKAGVDYLGRNLQAELDLRGLPILVHLVYPGIVDTAMQETVRGVSEERFPDVGRFRRWHEQGRLRQPEQPATLIWWLATGAATDLRGQVVDIDDADVRARMAADLGVAAF